MSVLSLYYTGGVRGREETIVIWEQMREGDIKLQKNIFTKLHPKICHLATLLIVWNLPPWWKGGQDFCPPPPLLHSLNLNMRVLCTIQGAGGEWGGNVTFLFWERSVLLPFPLGIYTIIYPVPTYVCTVYVYTMELGGGGRGAGCNRRSRVRRGEYIS